MPDNSGAGSRIRGTIPQSNNLPVYQFTQLGSATNITYTNTTVANFTSTTLTTQQAIPCQKLNFSYNDGNVKSPVFLGGAGADDLGPQLKSGTYLIQFTCRLNTSGSGSARVQLWLDPTDDDAFKVAESRTIVSTAVTKEPITVECQLDIDLDDSTPNILVPYLASTAASSSVFVESDYKLTIVCLSRKGRLL